MRKIMIGLMLSFYTSASANEPITITIDSLTNVRGNGAIEACGTAVHKDGVRPLLVTLKHSDSFYTTLTAPNDKWCVVIKRSSFNGEVLASATTLSEPGHMEFRELTIKK